MSEEGATEEDILVETDNNSEVEAKAEECIVRLRWVLTQTKLYLHNETVSSSAENWLTNLSPSSTNFIMDRKLLIKQLEGLVK